MEQVEGSAPRLCRHRSVHDGGASGRQRLFLAREPGDWMRRAKWVRGVPEACWDDLMFAAVEGARRSWCLGPLRGKLADEHKKARAAARADAGSVDLFRIDGVCAHLGSMRRRLTVEEKQQTGAGSVVALGGMP